MPRALAIYEAYLEKMCMKFARFGAKVTNVIKLNCWCEVIFIVWFTCFNKDLSVRLDLFQEDITNPSQNDAVQRFKLSRNSLVYGLDSWKTNCALPSPQNDSSHHRGGTSACVSFQTWRHDSRHLTQITFENIWPFTADYSWKHCGKRRLFWIIILSFV